jgi:predicted transcriptional regulator
MAHKATLLRLRPEIREMLDKLAEDQRRSRVSIVEAAVREYYRSRESTEDKLSRMITNAKL